MADSWKQIKVKILGDFNYAPNQWVQWITVIDERTSPGCRALHECIFIFAKCPDWPEHPNCRCKLNKVGRPDASATSAIEKFSVYLWEDKYTNPASPLYHGKDTVFLEMGYLQNSSELLRSIYTEQAREKYRSGDYTLGKLNKWGQHIDIVVDLPTSYGVVSVISGWMVKPNGLIQLNAPFSGYARRIKK